MTLQVAILFHGPTERCHLLHETFPQFSIIVLLSGIKRKIRKRGHEWMMAVKKCGYSGWWCVSFDRMIIAKFRTLADANIYVLCCVDSGHAKQATLASGLVI